MFEQTSSLLPSRQRHTLMLYIVFVSIASEFCTSELQSINVCSRLIISHVVLSLIYTLWTNGHAGTGLCGRLFRGTQPGRDSSGIGITQPHAIRIVRQTWHKHDPHDLVRTC